MTTKSVGQSPNMMTWGAGLKAGLNAAEKQLVKAAVTTVAEFTKQAAAQLEQLTKTVAATTGKTDSLEAQAPSKALDDVFNKAATGAPSAPAQTDAAHPQGSLKKDDNGVITTPGGYKIESTGQFNWKITGPDGKSTEVWGDPHVKESDGGTWDFKRNSSFVLGDGTKIDVTCKPYGNGATVSGQLDISCGNDRVSIKDIDKGKGKTGEITHDAAEHAGDFDGIDTFYMGKETDDWSFEYREIVGSEDQGDRLTLGTEHMEPGYAPARTLEQQGTPSTTATGGSTGTTATPTTPTTPATPATPTTPTPQGQTGSTATKPGNALSKLTDLFKSLSKVFESLNKLSEMLNRRAPTNTGIVPQGTGTPAQRRKSVLEQSFSQIGRMLDTALRFEKLSRSIETNRNRFLA